MLDLIQESVEFVFYLYQNLLLVRLVFYFLLVIVSLSIYLKHKTKIKRSKYPANTVILHQFPRTVNYKVPSPSPFCVKLETWLKMAHIPYQNEFGFSSSSKGKIPWITLNGVEVADSQFCIDYLSQEFKIDLNRNIKKNELAAARAFFKLSEESIFYCVMLSRFKYYPGHAGFPQPIFSLMKPRVLEISKIQGYGRHTEEEVIKIVKSDLKSINDYIENNKYLTGETVCNEDSALFGVLSLLVYQDCGKITDYVKNECPNIIRYMNNIKVTYWPDWNDNIRHNVIGFFSFVIKTLYSIFE